jgi:hypothetical protein
MSENTVLDLESLANETLDSIPEAPDFVTPPAGEYTLSVKDAAIDKYKDKEGTAKQRLKITYTILDTKSVAGNEQPVPNDSIFTETFMATEQGVGYFKKRVKEIMMAENVSGVTLGEMMNSIKGVSFDCRISIKKSPNPKGGEYENVQIRVVKPQ